MPVAHYPSGETVELYPYNMQFFKRLLRAPPPFNNLFGYYPTLWVKTYPYGDQWTTASLGCQQILTGSNRMKLRLQTWSDNVVPLEDSTGFGQKYFYFDEGWIWKKFEMSHLIYTVSINGKTKLSFTTDPNVLKSIIVVQKTMKLRTGFNKI